MYGLTRGLMTLIAAAIAGGMLWFAGWIGPQDSNSDYWIAMAVVAGAGLVLALSQLAGGWTKFGPPRISVPVLGFGFLPGLAAGLWILAAAQPGGNQARENVLGWSSDIGIGNVVSDLTLVVGAIAFGLGLVFGLVFDTAGPRREVVDGERYVDEDRDLDRDRAARAERGRYAEDEPVAAERRRPYADGTYDGGTYDGDVDGDSVARPAREPVAVGTARDERATPSAPQPEPDPEARPRRRSFLRR